MPARIPSLRLRNVPSETSMSICSTIASSTRRGMILSKCIQWYITFLCVCPTMHGHACVSDHARPVSRCVAR